MDAQGFHDGFAAQFGFQAKQIFEGAIGEVNPAVAVEQQQPFQHAVEQDLLLRLGVNRGLLFPPQRVFPVSLNLPLLAPEFSSPPEMNAKDGYNSQNRQERPHAERMKDEG